MIALSTLQPSEDGTKLISRITSVEEVRLLLRRGDGAWRPALPSGAFRTAGTAEDGAVVDGLRLWKVPLALGTYRDYALKLVGYTGGAAVGSDESDGPIGIGPVALTAPQAGEVLLGGRRFTVRWQRFGTMRPVVAVRLRYTLDGGESWKLAGFAPAGAREYSWRVPVLKRKSERCRVAWSCWGRRERCWAPAVRRRRRGAASAVSARQRLPSSRTRPA